jgi:hypothetical protein
MQSLRVFHFISCSQKRDVLSKLLIASHIIFYFVGIRRFFVGFFLQQSCLPGYVGRGSAYCSDIVHTCMTASFYWEAMFGTKKNSYYWSVCSKPKRIAVIYMCVFPHRFVTYVFAYDFPIEFWNCFLPTIYLLNFVIVMTVWYVFHIIFLPKNIYLVHCYINSLIQ